MPVGAFTPNTAAPMGVAAPGESPLQPEGPDSSLPGLLQSPSAVGPREKSAGEGRADSKLGVKKNPEEIWLCGSFPSWSWSHPCAQHSLLRRPASLVNPVLRQPSQDPDWIQSMELTPDGETVHHEWGVCPGSRVLGEGPLLVLSSSWQSNLSIEGSGRRNWETFVCGGLCCLQRRHQHQPCVGKGKVPEWESPTKGHQGAVRGWDEAGHLCSIPGDTGFTGRHPAELGLCRCHWGEP